MGAATVAAAVWLLQHLKGKSYAIPIYIGMGSGGAVILVGILCMVGALCRHKMWGRCMMYILTVILFVTIVMEAATVGFLYKYSGACGLRQDCFAPN
jgi:hypothetical protein